MCGAHIFFPTFAPFWLAIGAAINSVLIEVSISPRMGSPDAPVFQRSLDVICLLLFPTAAIAPICFLISMRRPGWRRSILVSRVHEFLQKRRIRFLYDCYHVASTIVMAVLGFLILQPGLQDDLFAAAIFVGFFLFFLASVVPFNLIMPMIYIRVLPEICEYEN